MNVYNMADTWNASGTTFNGIMMDISDGASGTPVYAAASRAINIKSNGTSKFAVAVEGGIIQAMAANYAAMAVTGYSLTGSSATSLIDLAGTWNTSGTPTAIKLNITNTASNASSLLMDLQVGGVSKFKVDYTGVVTTASAAIFAGYFQCPGSSFFGDNEFRFSTDAYMARDAADVLAQRRTTNAQTFRVYGTWTNASNYERASISHVTGTGSILAAETAGTGGDNLSLRLTAAGTGSVVSAFPMTIMDGTAIPSGGTAGAGYMFSSTSNFGVFFGSGAPSLSAAQGSVYLRSDGTTINNRLYVNTNGSTTWTAVTTAG